MREFPFLFIYSSFLRISLADLRCVNSRFLFGDASSGVLLGSYHFGHVAKNGACVMMSALMISHLRCVL